MTSQLRHHYIVLCKYWWDILQFFSHTNCHDLCCKNCEKLSKFIEVTTKILLVLFFWTQCRWFFIFSLTAFNIKLKTVFIADRLQGQICIGCKYWFVQWSQDKPTVTIEHCTEVGTTDPVAALWSCQRCPVGRGDHPFSAGCWLIQWGGCWNSQASSAAVDNSEAGASCAWVWLFQHSPQWSECNDFPHLRKARMWASFLSHWWYSCFYRVFNTTSRHFFYRFL